MRVAHCRAAVVLSPLFVPLPLMLPLLGLLPVRALLFAVPIPFAHSEVSLTALSACGQLIRTVTSRAAVASNRCSQSPSLSEIVLYGRDCMIGSYQLPCHSTSYIVRYGTDRLSCRCRPAAAASLDARPGEADQSSQSSLLTG
jgi:hypothetical protein